MANVGGGDAYTIHNREEVIVAVKAEKVIAKTALAWALTHIVSPGNNITLLAVSPQRNTGRRTLWGLRKLKGDCQPSESENSPDRMVRISDSCSQMVLQFHNQMDVRVRIKVISATSAGVVASEAKNSGAKWVILDKKLKQERKHCLEELCCNIVVMKGTQPKVLRLDLERSGEIQTPFYSMASSPIVDNVKIAGQMVRHCTPASSPDEPCTSYTLSSGENAFSSPDTGTPTFLAYKQNPLYEKMSLGNHNFTHKNGMLNPHRPPDSFSERAVTLSAAAETYIPNDKRVFFIPENHGIDERASKILSFQDHLRHAYSTIRGKKGPVESNQCMSTRPNSMHGFAKDFRFNTNIREAVSLGRTSSNSPPLCSQCQQKSPTFGKPPRLFNYEELEEATDGFADKNFVAEGGFGLVFRGVLRDGLIIAVKQLKFFRSQRDADFSREVRVLSCAQHRNVVLLIGFCIEPKKRLLVYEYVCNGSLDLYLHGKTRINLDWNLRLKIATGTARGLRYLHEDCRVGCIIHRDMRPHNILLTHDFEPLVADFGLARLHREWEIGDEEQIVGRHGYLAPEYFNDTNVTEKVDVYAFGLVLLELITGHKISDMQYYTGNFLPFENLCHLSPMEQIQLLSCKLQFLDSHFARNQLQNLSPELQAMSHAASLCLQKDPDLRPTMSKVLRVLEGGGTTLHLDLNTIGSQSGYMKGLNSSTTFQSRSKHSRTLSH